SRMDGDGDGDGTTAFRRNLAFVDDRLTLWRDRHQALAGVTIDRKDHSLTYGGRYLKLTRREADLLDFLVRHPGRHFTTRQLIAQSKRLMLTSLERRSQLRGGEELRKRAERIRDETDNAHRTYRAAVLTWGQATSLEFRLIAYSSLADLAESLVVELLDTIGGQSARD